MARLSITMVGAGGVCRETPASLSESDTALPIRVRASAKLIEVTVCMLQQSPVKVDETRYSIRPSVRHSISEMASQSEETEKTK